MMGSEPLAQFLKVINLAVENDPGGLIFVRHRLMAACHINNAQAAEAQPDGVFGMKSILIWPAMDHLVGHTV
jgi:hypothetical protein